MKKIYFGRDKKLFTVVDDADYEELAKFHWYLGSKGYAVRQVRKKNVVTVILMHRVIMQTPGGMDTDHINRNKLDNRRSNLRVCTHQENLLNRGVQKNNKTGYAGVYLSQIKGTADKYVARVKRHGISRHLGRFNTAEEANVVRLNYLLREGA